MVKFILSYTSIILLSLSIFSQEQKTLTVFAGIEGVKEAPFSVWKIGDKEPTGLDPDVLRLIAKELNVKLSFFKVDLSKGWVDLRRELLEAKLVDMLAYAYTVTEDRKKFISFSSPYLVSTMNALILRDSKIKSKKDLEEKNVLVFGHTTAYKWALKNVKGKIYKSYPENNNFSIYKLLETNTIDAYLGDYYSLVDMAKVSGKFVVLKDPLQKEELAIAFPKDKKDLKVKVNNALKKLEKNGSLEKLRKKYFNPKLSDKGNP